MTPEPAETGRPSRLASRACGPCAKRGGSSRWPAAGRRGRRRRAALAMTLADHRPALRAYQVGPARRLATLAGLCRRLPFPGLRQSIPGRIFATSRRLIAHDRSFPGWPVSCWGASWRSPRRSAWAMAKHEERAGRSQFFRAGLPAWAVGARRPGDRQHVERPRSFRGSCRYRSPAGLPRWSQPSVPRSPFLPPGV